LSASSPTYWLAAIVSFGVPVDSVPNALWPQIVEQACQHGLASLLLYLLKQSGKDVEKQPDWRPLVEASQRAAVQYLLIQLAQKQIQQQFIEASIASIWIKGIALAQTVYPEPSLRPMGDLDVLIPFDQRERALKAVKQLGYRPWHDEELLFETTDSLFLATARNYALIGGPGNALILELHFRLIGAELPLEYLNYFWENTCYVGDFQILTPELHLVYLCAHAEVQHGQSELYLLRYYDLHRLVISYALDWSQIIDLAVQLRWTYAVSHALSRCITYFSTPVPDGMLNQLEARRMPNEDVSRVRNLKHSETSWARIYSRLTSLSTLQRFRLIANLILPPRRYMRVRYAIPENKSVWPFYLYRWYLQIRSIMLSVHNYWVR
jgi:hypothetical protein